MIVTIILLIILLTLLGLPIFAAIMAAAMLGLHSNGVDLSAVAIEISRLANAPVLLAVPLFTFAGYLLGHGGTSERLVRFSRSLFGWIPGGLGVVALVTCAFFTAITGATGVTIIALGGLLFPALISEGYSENFSLGLMTASGSLGLHFPPSLPIILYGFVSGASIEKLFIAGVLPGALMVGILCIFSVFMGKKWKLERPPFSFSQFIQALKGAAWELPIPFLIILAIYTGFSTATEAAALTVAYVLLIKTLVFRELTLFAKIGFLLILNVFLILVGCMMDIFSAILVVVPLIMPLAQKFGVEPIHLGVIFLANLGIGYNTPPVGLNLFIASSRFDRPIMQLYRSTIPFLGLLLLTLLIITYWPPLSLFLPSFLE